MRNPSWWNDTHSQLWEHAREELRRDWEQSEAQLARERAALDRGSEGFLRQADELGQGANTDALAKIGTAALGDWESAEEAVRFGYVARQHYGDADWSEDLERLMRGDWEGSQSESTFDWVKNAIKHGWQSIRRRSTRE